MIGEKLGASISLWSRADAIFDGIINFTARSIFLAAPNSSKAQMGTKNATYFFPVFFRKFGAKGAIRNLRTCCKVCAGSETSISARSAFLIKLFL